MRWAASFLVPLAAMLSEPLPPGYTDSAACAACHKDIAEAYRRTGMGRSFYRPAPENTVEGVYEHRPSNQHFRMYQSDGRYFQRRHQIGPDGRETNVVEKEVHYILGSGNHSRTYLHRTPSGQLVELPVAWYAEKGGFLAMNPGYDRPDHMDFRRKIEKECFNCHNAYAASASEANSPDLFLPGNIPEGIDCQRCHGPGAQHVRNPRAGIVNPARLSSERQLEICFQCHLKSTTLRLPSTIRRFDRGYFYRPGEPLEDYVLHFDSAPRSGDKFEIAHSAYRLLKSACFVKSKGALLCTTCHSPHGVQPDYARVCLDCHRTGLPANHVQSRDCVTCHMPKRRTDDVVHAVMTDHYIQRNKPARDLLAPLTEVHETEKTAYKGEVVLLYPPTRGNSLYLAVAQVAEGANLKAGLPRLQAAIDTYRPREAEFYFYLADAYRQNGQKDRSIRYYQEALRRKPDFLAARLNSAALLNKSDAAQSLEIAAKIAPRDPSILNKLAEAYLDLGKTEQAVTNLQRAVTLDPDFAEAYENLANILQAAGDFLQAESHFKTSIALDPESVAAHFNYGRALAAKGMLDRGQAEFETALRLDPDSPEAATGLGILLAMKGQLDPAIKHYRHAIQVQPQFLLARLHLALALISRGGRHEAKQLLQSVIRSDPNDHQAQLELGKILLSEGNRDAAAVCLRKASESPQAELRTAAQRLLKR